MDSELTSTTSTTSTTKNNEEHKNIMSNTFGNGVTVVTGIFDCSANVDLNSSKNELHPSSYVKLVCQLIPCARLKLHEMHNIASHAYVIGCSQNYITPRDTVAMIQYFATNASVAHVAVFAGTHHRPESLQWLQTLVERNEVNEILSYLKRSWRSSVRNPNNDFFAYANSVIITYPTPDFFNLKTTELNQFPYDAFKCKDHALLDVTELAYQMKRVIQYDEK